MKGERTGELVGQDAGKALLMIEARIGQLLPPPKEALKTALAGGTRQKRLYGMDDSQAKRSRAISSHPAEVAEVIKEAGEMLGRLERDEAHRPKKLPNDGKLSEFNQVPHPALYVSELQGGISKFLLIRLRRPSHTRARGEVNIGRILKKFSIPLSLSRGRRAAEVR